MDGGGIVVSPVSSSTYYSTGSGYYYDGTNYWYCYLVSKTTDAGVTWHRDTLQATTDYIYGNSIAVHPTNANLVYTAGYNSIFYKSTDAGSTWSLLNSGLTNTYYIYDIAPNSQNANIIYLATYNGVYKTTNGGTNWAATTLTGTVNDVLVHPRGPDTVYAGTGAGFYKSTNAGGSWTQQNGGLVDPNVTCLAINSSGVRDSSFIFCGTKGGGMHRQFLMLIPVEEQKTETARIRFAIDPNPARDRARFQYTIDHPARIEIKIYDPQGRLVETLVDGQSNAGTHYADWNCRTQAAGIYFVKAVTDQACEIRKLILVR
jgi:hypothetical protein